MTVVPDDPLMTLICDSCGTVASGPACVLPDAEVVWTFVAEQGWTGSPFATGPHRCPRCELLPAPTPQARAPRRADPLGVLGVEHLDEVAIVTAAGDLDIATGDDLHGVLAEAVDADRHVVVDLVRVHLIDSTALGVLVRAGRRPGTAAGGSASPDRPGSSAPCCTPCGWTGSSRSSTPAGTRWTGPGPPGPTAPRSGARHGDAVAAARRGRFGPGVPRHGGVSAGPPRGPAAAGRTCRGTGPGRCPSATPARPARGAGPPASPNRPPGPAPPDRGRPR